MALLMCFLIDLRSDFINKHWFNESLFKVLYKGVLNLENIEVFEIKSIIKR